MTIKTDDIAEKIKWLEMKHWENGSLPLKDRLIMAVIIIFLLALAFWAFCGAKYKLV